MKYILIAIWMTNSSMGTSNFTAEFNSKEACEAAANDMTEWYRWAYDYSGGRYNAYMRTKCYEKGAE
jgi:hypothetical protein